MASIPQQSNPTEPPPRLSRYRSARKTHARQAVANAPPLPQPSLPTSHNASFAPPTASLLHHNGAAVAIAKPIDPLGAASAQSDEPSTEKQSIQRSMSRYRKTPKPNAIAAVSPPLVPSMPAKPQHVPADSIGPRSADLKQQDVKMVVRERSAREPRDDNERSAPYATQEQGVPTSIPALGNPPSQTLVSNNVQPEGQALDTQQISAARSRYRRQRPTKQDSDSNLRSRAHHQDAQNTMPPNSKQEHREAMRRIRKQASFPAPTSVEQPPLSRLLTKASLDQIPDANKEDSENYFNQIKAITRQSTLGSQNNASMPRAPRAHASRAQNEVKKMMDAETERQRRMQEKIKIQREKARAQEEEQARAKRRDEERQIAEEHQREEKERHEKASAEAAARQKKDMEKAERKKVSSKRHQRKESEAERAKRHRDQSLSALEANESNKKPFQEIVQDRDEAANAKEPLGFLKRRRADEPKSSNGIGESKNQLNQVSNDETTIRPGGGGAVPGVDAPISAVNAGDRKVLLECNKSSIYLPVTTATTPVDLIRSAATCLNETIDPKASVLLESFGKVGVQRPLRNYEHIRNIMNSWDDDRQNSLILVPSATGGADVDLDSSSVFAEQPDEVSFQLHYSQRPGKWEKRWISLRSDGQMVSTKSQGHKDVTNVCHMSDFDIYTPSQQQLTKTIKPPKKMCFAIKSQQKSSMFMTTENFVHFFSIADKQTAAAWYKAVQGWRSWYLVNIMGEGTKPQPRKDKNSAPVLPDITETQHRPGSKDSHYQLGSFKPLLDFGTFGFASEASSGDQLGSLGTTSHSRGKPSNSNGPPSSFPKNLINDSDTSHLRKPSASLMHASADNDTFAPTGLLGRSYSTRQKAQKERELAQSPEGPFTGGLLENSVRPSMDQSHPNAGDLTRSPSNARRVKPLIDITPAYQDPPQQTRKGRGFVPEQVGPGGLISLATGPEVGSDWRARPTTRGDGGNGHSKSDSSGIARRRSVRQPDEHGFDQSASPFAADGLLSSGPAGQGQGTTGRGVMDGSKVRMSQGMGPMLDMNLPSNFVDGSLLRKVEAEQGPQQPIISRGKGEEVVVGTGEGV